MGHSFRRKRLKTKVLVTGATGFLGGFLVKRLLEAGFEPHVLVRDSEKARELRSSGCEVLEGDLLKPETLNFNGLDGVFHLAALISAFPADRKDLMSVNVQGTKNVVDACIRDRVQKLIHISSVVAVGTNLSKDDPLLNESSSNRTIGLNFANYDSKRLGEEIVLEAARKNLLNATVLNPGLIYGPGDARKTIRKGNVLAAKGRLAVYPTGGVNIVSVYDVVEAIVTAFAKGRSGERYLLTGDNITVQELLTTISQYTGKNPPRKPFPRFLKLIAKIIDKLNLNSQLNGETLFSTSTFHWYENTKARKELGFHPRSYKEAIRSSVDWMIESKFLENT